MKIGDFLYFAPEITFSQVDLGGRQLPKQYEARLEGYYLTPAEVLSNEGHGFAAGLLVVTAIDALARLARRERTTGERIRAWVRSELKGLNTPEHANALYNEIRNGLVHEARLKAGTEFSLEQDILVDSGPGFWRLNPRLLLVEVREALKRFVQRLEADADKRQEFLERLTEEFDYELQGLT